MNTNVNSQSQSPQAPGPGPGPAEGAPQVPMPLTHDGGGHGAGRAATHAPTAGTGGTTGTASPWTAPVSLGNPDDYWRAPDDSSQAVPLLPQELLSLLRVPSGPDDAAGFSQASRPQEAPPGAAALDHLGIELRALVEAGGVEIGESCKFELEVPGLGRLSGRLALRTGGQAQLELHSPRQTVAATLRARQQELQRSVDHATRGEVSLFIV